MQTHPGSRTSSSVPHKPTAYAADGSSTSASTAAARSVPRETTRSTADDRGSLIGLAAWQPEVDAARAEVVLEVAQLHLKGVSGWAELICESSVEGLFQSRGV